MPYTKLGAGYLNKNKDATEANKKPHWNGTVDFEEEGKQPRKIQIAGWVRKNKQNEDYMYFAFSEHIKKEEASNELPF